MKNIQREDVHILSRHSDLTEDAIEQVLKENVYNDKAAWQKFLQLFFITLGIGFTVSGIIFFFAYNWADLHKFAKLGLTQALIIGATALVLLPKININIRHIILTGAAMLVGVLFAVYGQIYQTGANAYDFFLVWTIFVTLWVFVANFAPLWLVYLVLINTTFYLYSEQVAQDWSQVFVYTSLFAFNSAVMIGAIILSKYRQKITVPNWFLNTVGVAAAGFATVGISVGIYEDYEHAFLVLIILTAIIYALGIWHGLTSKSGSYLAIIPFSLIIIISAWLLKISHNEGMFLVVSIFIIGSVTWVIKNLIDQQKKWNHEQ